MGGVLPTPVHRRRFRTAGLSLTRYIAAASGPEGSLRPGILPPLPDCWALFGPVHRAAPRRFRLIGRLVCVSAYVHLLPLRAGSGLILLSGRSLFPCIFRLLRGESRSRVDSAVDGLQLLLQHGLRMQTFG